MSSPKPTAPSGNGLLPGIPYKPEAGQLVLEALERYQQGLSQRRHVTGVELSWACRDLAWKKYGLLALDVLASWGITCTADLGRVVYLLIELGVLQRQEDDREEDFLDVYSFEKALVADYQIQWLPESEAREQKAG